MRFALIALQNLRANALRRSRLIASLAVFCGTLAGAPARADVIDPAGDFLGTYTGPQNGDLDALRTDVVYDGSTFHFTATMNAAIGTTAGAQYVWGFDRGQGTARFQASLGLDGVLFDSVVAITTAGGSVRDLIANANTFTLAAADIHINGAQISFDVPKSALVSEGLRPGDYTFNLWPRLSGGTVANIADFAPNNSNAQVRSVPEPGSLAMLALGGGFVAQSGLMLRRRKAKADAAQS